METRDKYCETDCKENHPHHRPALRFKIDCEDMVVHTDRLTVRELLDLVEVDPSKHYIIELGNPEDIPHKNLDEVISLRECAEFITVLTGETPVS